jgi:hypothetical protein
MGCSAIGGKNWSLSVIRRKVEYSIKGVLHNTNYSPTHFVWAHAVPGALTPLADSLTIMLKYNHVLYPNSFLTFYRIIDFHDVDGAGKHCAEKNIYT